MSHAVPVVNFGCVWLWNICITLYVHALYPSPSPLARWYHPSISRHIAESLLMHRDILNGTFLLRNSSNSDESLTLSVRSAGRREGREWGRDKRERKLVTVVNND